MNDTSPHDPSAEAAATRVGAHVAETIAVVGLGYVGLPVALALSAVADKVVGYDIRRGRVDALNAGHDATGEADETELAEAIGAGRLVVTAEADAMKGATTFIITVPTPVDIAKEPDLTVLLGACDVVGSQLRPGGLVIIESTVHPGASEELCVPRLEEASGLTFGVDFALGYSPERINPGDKVNSFRTIKKIIAGSDAAAVRRVERIYGSVVEGGLHVATSIKVAEAAKMLENTQRDVNIALMNEVAMIFDHLKIRTADVLAAAGTKWNFLRFEPGLVGGHCIGVDPYYLASKAIREGAVADLILTSRRINEAIPDFIAGKTLDLLKGRGVAASAARIGVFGVCFKADVPDIRNSLSPRIAQRLIETGATVLSHDPVADPADVEHEYELKLVPLDAMTDLDAVVLAVPHEQFRREGAALYERLRRPGVMLDVKAVIGPAPDGVDYWSL